MIKDLIYDITYDKIKLSQALTRGKLIANKIKSIVFKNWLTSELEGYKSLDDDLPSYRKLFSPVSVVIDYPNGESRTVPVKVGKDADPMLFEMIHYQHMTRPISILEEEMNSITSAVAPYVLSSDVTDIIKAPYNKIAKLDGGAVRYASRLLAKSDYQRIIELTKQRLIDTLVELDDEFPNLVNEYKMTEENNNKVSNIVTNHIYGANSPVTNAVGVNVELGSVSNDIDVSQHNELEKLGVERREIEELERIIKNNQGDEPKRKSSIGKWLGSVLASAASKGIVDNIPKITEYVTGLL